MERKLVTVRVVDEIAPIENADAIERARCGGWDVVVKKGEVSEGNLCVFFEIDSFLRNDHRFQFLMKNKITWNGHVGARLKTIRLRGQISQGLILPLSEFPEVEQLYNGEPQDQDFSELLGVLKWEKYIPAQLAGRIRGNFPTFLRKTDQERAANIVPKIFADASIEYEVSMKLEGSSITIFNYEDRIGVCSRNLELKIDDFENVFVKTALSYGFDKHTPEGYAIQGELMGPGIQDNIEGFTEHKIFVFDIFDIANYRYLSHDERIEFLLNLGCHVDHVPILGVHSLADLNIGNIDDLIAYADGPSINAKYREGVVFKATDRDFTFKQISNKYLEKMG